MAIPDPYGLVRTRHLPSRSWPDYLWNGDVLAATLMLAFRQRHPDLKIIAMVSVTDTKVIQLIMGEERGSRKVAVLPESPAHADVVFLLEDDGTDSFEFNPKITGVTTFGEILDAPFATLELDKYENDRLKPTPR